MGGASGSRELSDWVVLQLGKAKEKLTVTLDEPPMIRFREGGEPVAVFYGSAGSTTHVVKHFPILGESNEDFIARVNKVGVGDLLVGEGHTEISKWQTEGGKWLSTPTIVLDVLRGPESAMPSMPMGVEFPPFEVR